LGLVVGFACLTVAAALAHGASATAYELSIYAATPLSVWLCLGAAFVVSVASLTARDRRIRALAATLGTAATTLLAAMFLVRDYRYLGGGDALSHLGWAKGIAGGGLQPAELLYPATHLLGVSIQAAGGGTLARGLLLVTVLFAVAYVVATGLVVRRLTQTRRGFAIGVAAAWLFLPVFNVASYLMPFPTTQGIFFAPFVVFALLVYLQRGSGSERTAALPACIALVVLGAGLVLVHPQQAVNVVLLLGAVFVVQTASRRYRPEHPIATQPSVLVPTGLLGGLLAVWMSVHPRAESATTGVLAGVLNVFDGPDAAATVAQRSGSVADVGGSTPMLAFKLLGVGIFFVVLSAVAVAVYWRRRDAAVGTEHVVPHLAAGTVPIGVLFVSYFLSTPTIAFRELAFGLFVATVLGAVGLQYLWGGLQRRFGHETATTVTAAILAACLVLSAVTVFPSPYIFKPTPHVTTHGMAGHESAFALGGADWEYGGLRRGPGRYAHGIHGLDDPVDMRTPYDGGGIPESVFATGNYSAASDLYLLLLRADYEREVTLYEGLRYGRAGFERLTSTPGVDRVLDNGGFDLYAINDTG
jgi:hypothetical protein